MESGMVPPSRLHAGLEASGFVDSSHCRCKRLNCLRNRFLTGFLNAPLEDETHTRQIQDLKMIEQAYCRELEACRVRVEAEPNIKER